MAELERRVPLRSLMPLCCRLRPESPRDVIALSLVSALVESALAESALAESALAESALAESALAESALAVEECGGLSEDVRALAEGKHLLLILLGHHLLLLLMKLLYLLILDLQLLLQLKDRGGICGGGSGDRGGHKGGGRKGGGRGGSGDRGGKGGWVDCWDDSACRSYGSCFVRFSLQECHLAKVIGSNLLFERIRFRRSVHLCVWLLCNQIQFSHKWKG